jgi:GGDEF domain-containing protein
MRNALERHRLLDAARATSMTDPLTGLLTRPAFVTLAERDRLLAERIGRRLMILVAERVEPDALDGTGLRAYGEQSRDLALVEAADDLRRLAGPAALVARLSHSRFGLAALDTLAESVEEVRSRLQAAGADGKLMFGAAVFHPQEPVSLDILLEHATQGLHSKANNVVA